MKAILYTDMSVLAGGSNTQDITLIKQGQSIYLERGYYEHIENYGTLLIDPAVTFGQLTNYGEIVIG